MTDKDFDTLFDDSLDKFNLADETYQKAVKLYQTPATSGGESWKQAIEYLNQTVDLVLEGKESLQRSIEAYAKDVDDKKIFTSKHGLNRIVKRIEGANEKLKFFQDARERFIKAYNSSFPDKALPIPDRVFGGKRRKSRKQKRRARKTLRK